MERRQGGQAERMSKRKKQTGRYVVEINDWGCGTMIKDTLTGKEIDAPAEETVNLCLAEMNRLAAEVERLTKAIEGSSYYFMSIKLNVENARLRKAGDAMARIIAPPTHGTGEWDGEWDAWNAAKEGKSV